MNQIFQEKINMIVQPITQLNMPTFLSYWQIIWTCGGDEIYRTLLYAFFSFSM